MTWWCILPFQECATAQLHRLGCSRSPCSFQVEEPLRAKAKHHTNLKNCMSWHHELQLLDVQVMREGLLDRENELRRILKYEFERYKCAGAFAGAKFGLHSMCVCVCVDWGWRRGEVAYTSISFVQTNCNAILIKIKKIAVISRILWAEEFQAEHWWQIPCWIVMSTTFSNA